MIIQNYIFRKRIKYFKKFLISNTFEDLQKHITNIKEIEKTKSILSRLTSISISSQAFLALFIIYNY